MGSPSKLHAVKVPEVPDIANLSRFLFTSIGTLSKSISQANLTELIKKHFDLRPAAIIKEFNLRNLPKKMGGKFFRKTASYGHFGRRDLELPWENVDEKAAQLAEASKVFL